MNKIFAWVLARAKEQSTYSGIAMVLATASFVPYASEIGALMPTVGILVMGIIKIVQPDPGVKA